MTDDELLVALMKQHEGMVDSRAVRLAGEDMMLSKAKQLSKLGELLFVRPDDPALLASADKLLDDFFLTVQSTAGIDTELGRQARFLQERWQVGLDLAERAAKAVGDVPPSELSLGTHAQKAAQKAAAAGGKRTPAQTRAAVRMFQMANGLPIHTNAILGGIKVLVHTGAMAKTMFYFRNMLLMGPRVLNSIMYSGLTMSTTESLIRAVGGAAQGNSAVAMKGLRMLYSMPLDAIEGTKAALKYMDAYVDISSRAGTALRTGSGQVNIAHMGLDPHTVHVAIANKFGDLMGIPGLLTGGADEFNKVMVYRMQVRAQAIGKGLDMGLSGAQLASFVDGQLRASVDPLTGAATNADALAVARRVTLSAPLKDNSVGAALQEFARRVPAFQLLDPFIRTSGNSLDQTFQALPGLGFLNKEVQAELAKGGENAIAVKGRMAVAAGTMAWALHMATSGRLSGKGPSDPGARHVWKQNHPLPYAWDRTGHGDWVSFSRNDQFNSFLGLVADAVDVHDARVRQGSKFGAEDILAMLGKAAYNSTVNKSYNQGVSRFLDAMSGSDEATNRWMAGLGSAFIVPSGASAMNPDSTLRSTVNAMEMIQARTPVLSDKLPPQYNFVGEYQYKPSGWWNRGASSTPEDVAKGTHLETVIENLGKGFTPPPRMQAGGTIDLADNKYRDKSGMTAWDYMNKTLREGFNGRPGLRQALEEVIQSDQFQARSPGTVDFPGGAQYMQIDAIVKGYYQAALASARKHSTTLDKDLRAYEITKASALVPEGERRNALLDMIQKSAQ
jgi:hypothetical protein